MSIFTPWEEVYSSTDLTEVMRRESILRSKGIDFKTRETNNLKRFGRSDFGGRSGPQNETYRILVKADKAETARYHLYQDKPSES
jgi:hypothetical protein